MAKKRSDSKLGAEPIRSRVIQWLVEDNLSYDDAQKQIWDDFGVRVSKGTLSEFYRTECFTLRSSEAKAFAEHVVETAQADGDKYDEATLALIKQRAFEQVLLDSGDGGLEQLRAVIEHAGDDAFGQRLRDGLELGRDTL